MATPARRATPATKQTGETKGKKRIRATTEADLRLVEPVEEDLRVTTGSGNPWADLGLPEAEEKNIKADIMVRLKLELLAQELTQTAAGERMGLKQPDVSAILRGTLTGYSVFKLLEALASLGYDLDIVSRRRADRSLGKIRFTSGERFPSGPVFRDRWGARGAPPSAHVTWYPLYRGRQRAAAHLRTPLVRPPNRPKGAV
jgi:predicted XRE-type DNA-binding protein